MAKSTKKVPGKALKPIADFFTRIPTSSQGTARSNSVSSQCRTKVEAEPGSSQPQTTVLAKANCDHAFKSGSASNTRADPLCLTSPRKGMKPERTKLQVSSRTASSKRSRSPDSTKISAEIQKDAEGRQAQARRSTPRKKARTSIYFLTSRGSSSNPVPSSQSDEDELQTPITECSDNSEAKESMKLWRRQALPPTPDPGDDSAPMDVDDNQSSWDYSGPPTPGFVTKASPSHRILTPPYTDGSSDNVLATPVVLDAATKTAQIIEQIRARALATVQSSPEMTTIDVPDELEDSDDDVIAQPLFPPVLRTDAAPSTSFNSASMKQVRRSSRQRHSPRVSSVTSSDEEPGPDPVKHRVRPNPILPLLKEKRKAEKNGKGSEAFLKAETNLFGKSSLLEEMNLEDGNENDLDYDNLKNSRSPLSFPLNHVDNIFIGEEDAEELEKNQLDRKEINGILKDDQLAREVEESQTRREGVQLWATGDENFMMLDEHHLIPEFASAGSSPTFQFLRKALRKRDFKRATMLLKSGALTCLNAADQPGNISDLCFLAISAGLHELPISEAAFRVTFDLLDLSTRGMKCPVPSSFVIRSMLELGAPPQRLAAAGLTFEPTSCSPQVDGAKRDSIIYRTTVLVAQAAIARRLLVDEIPDLVVTLVLVAMDPSTSHDLWRELMVAINHVCRSGSPINGSNRDAESVIASRLVALSEQYEPANKAALVSVLAGGTGATIRIARFIAYSMIVGYPSSSITSKTYCDPVPLPPMLKQLLQPSGNDVATVFTVNDDTDYTAMKHYVYILGVATTDIKAYVDLERQDAKAKPRPIGPSQREPEGATKRKTDLHLLHSLLEDLHASINDLRAAHLDRSRTKAVVKQLQMRIHYQRGAFERAWKDQNMPNLIMKKWLTAKSKIS